MKRRELLSRIRGGRSLSKDLAANLSKEITLEIININHLQITASVTGILRNKIRDGAYTTADFVQEVLIHFISKEGQIIEYAKRNNFEDYDDLIPFIYITTRNKVFEMIRFQLKQEIFDRNVDPILISNRYRIEEDEIRKIRYGRFDEAVTIIERIYGRLGIDIMTSIKSDRELSDEYGISENAIRQRRRRIKRRVAKEMEP